LIDASGRGNFTGNQQNLHTSQTEKVGVIWPL
jgi:hypothetical protein